MDDEYKLYGVSEEFQAAYTKSMIESTNRNRIAIKPIQDKILNIMEKNNLDEVYVTFQHKNSHLSNFYNNNMNISFTNDISTTEVQSYKWLHNIIGYYPIFAIKVSKHDDLDFFIHQYMYVAWGDNDKTSMFIISPNVECLKTDFYNWCDVHALLNEPNAEEGKLIPANILTLDYIKYIEDSERELQILFKEISRNDIIHYEELVFE